MNIKSLIGWLFRHSPRATVVLKKRDPACTVEVHAGDLIVVRTTGSLTPVREASLRRQFRRAFPGAQILVVDAATDFDVYGAD